MVKCVIVLEDVEVDDKLGVEISHDFGEVEGMPTVAQMVAVATLRDLHKGLEKTGVIELIKKGLR